MLTGECYCGSVKYKIDGDLNGMYYCHCSRCRKLTGSSFSTNGSLEASLFSIVEGQNFLERVDAWLTNHEIPEDQVSRVKARRVGLGLYWIQSDSSEVVR